jgi:4-hydroxybenzoate polyprenyltransferase
VSDRPLGAVARAAVRQLRPKQWFKNIFLFAALVFSREFSNPAAVASARLGFASFCLVSSAGYVLNDYLDREADRRHPRKRFRPIASGDLPAGVALVEMVVVMGAGVALAWSLSPWFLVVAMLYLATTLTYSFFFKHHVILDVMFISAGFVWRAIAGAVAISVTVSPWLFLCTAFLALFLGFHKRRAELVHVGDDVGTRKNLAEYSPQMLDQFQAIVTGNAVLCYSLYSILGTTPWMAVTIPYVLYGIFRYIYLVDQRGEGGSPTDTVLGDRPILLTGVLYVATALVVLTFAPIVPTTRF